MLFVGKKLLEQYEARISDLQKQITDLRSLALPITQPGDIPRIALEADAVLTGREEAYEPTGDISQEQLEAIVAEISERDKILSGNY